MKRNSLLVIVLALVTAFVRPAWAWDDVDITVKQFGVGSTFRPGDIAGVRVELLSNLSEAVQCFVQIEGADREAQDADGDVVEFGRSVALTPGRPTQVWLYVPIAPDASGMTAWIIRAFEERDGVRRSELGARQITPQSSGAQQETPADVGMIAIVGTRPMGLQQYATTTPGAPLGARPVAAHETTRAVFGIAPSELPDRWFGLRAFEAVAWATSAETNPQDLRADAANALAEYIRRGGHLIITLPEAGSQWALGSTTNQSELSFLLPTKAPLRDEGVKLSQLLPVLSKARTLPREIEGLSIRVFQEIAPDGSLRFNALDNNYEPLIALGDGRVVAAQRTYGHGRVTLIGIDVASGRLAGMPNGGLPQADVFWNRVLGRRADTPTADELVAMNTAERLVRMGGPELKIGTGRIFSDAINMASLAGPAILLALFLFGAYWVVAGPGGFGLLRMYKLGRHAWVVFAATAAVFTGLAWGSVSLLRQRQVMVQHVTFLDHIARPPGEARDLTREPQLQRASSYFSVFLPSYSPTRVSIESDPGQNDLLYSFIPPGVMRSRFPNVDRYTVDLRDRQADLLVPSRATAKNMYANWLGALDPSWGRMIHLADPNDPVRVELSATTGLPELRGSLVHELPGLLTDVHFIWIKEQREKARRYQETDGKPLQWVAQADAGRMLNVGEMYSKGATFAWDSGRKLDLGELVRGLGPGSRFLSTAMQTRYSEPYKSAGAFGLDFRPEDTARYMEMLSFFQQLTPPEYHRDASRISSEQPSFSRDIGRELDLSNWFNQPCLILYARLVNSPSPVPLRVNGEAVETNGITIVRWVYPLPMSPTSLLPAAEPIINAPGGVGGTSPDSTPHDPTTTGTITPSPR